MKKWLIMAGIFMVVGLIVFTVCLAITDFDFSKWETQNMVSNTYMPEETFANIRLDAMTTDILFLPSEDDQLQVVCYEDEKISHRVYVHNDTLVITCKDNRKWFERIGFTWARSKITVYLPAGEYGDLQISSTTGDISVSEHFTFHNANVNLTTGDTCWKAGVSQELAVQCTTGDVTLEQVLCSRLCVKVTTGDVQLSCVDASEIEIKTTTGDVTGTLLSGKVFTTKVTTGDVHVPHSSFGGNCKVTTTTGDIDLKIAE